MFQNKKVCLDFGGSSSEEMGWKSNNDKYMYVLEITRAFYTFSDLKYTNTTQIVLLQSITFTSTLSVGFV